MGIIITITTEENIKIPESDKHIFQMFERNKDGLSDDFMKLFKSMFYDVSKKAVFNKRNHFQSEYIDLVVGALIELITVISYCILSFNNFTKFTNLIFTFGTIFAFIAVVKYIVTSIKNSKKYGETWIRHTINKNELIYEMVRYMENIDCYEAVSKEKKQSLFKSAIISIEARNDERFAENMKKIK